MKNFIKNIQLRKLRFIWLLLPFLAINCTNVDFETDDPPYEERVTVFNLDIYFSGDYKDFKKELKFYTNEVKDENGNLLSVHTIPSDKVVNDHYHFTCYREGSVNLVLAINVREPSVTGKKMNVLIKCVRTQNKKQVKLDDEIADIDDKSFITSAITSVYYVDNPNKK